MADRPAAESEPLMTEVEIPPKSLKEELGDTFRPVRQLLIVSDDPFDEYRGKSVGGKIVTFLFWAFPILEWLSTYKVSYILGDLIGGLTIASLAVPQDLAYAGLAKVPPIYGLYSSFVPPLVYAALGTSRHIAIGPTAVVSLLLGSMLSDYVDPQQYPNRYLKLAWTATFFSGVIQAGMGFLRLGFIIDYLSHAAIVGFMAGAAVTIGLSQMKGLLGYKNFTNQTNIVAVLSYIFSNPYQFNWRAFLIGISFLTYLTALKILSWYFKNRKPLGRILFFANALGPLTSVCIATLAVFLTGANTLVPCISKMPKGLSNLSSINNLYLSGPWLGPSVAVGLVVGLISLTEAMAISRTFAAMKGYHIDGNKDMIALGAMNLAGSITSSIATTGSFSRSAVNYNAGGETMMTNIYMSLVIVFTLVAITQVFIYLPSAVLSAIIINAVATLIDLPETWRIWKTDKIDFLVVIGTFLGVIFESVEIGLLVGVALSMFKILVQVTRPQLTVLGEVPGVSVCSSVNQYKYAKENPGILVLRVDAPIYFTNANYLREKTLTLATKYEAHHDDEPLTHVVLDLTPVTDIDTTGIHSLTELLSALRGMDVQLGLANPSRIILRKLAASKFIEKLGQENIFMAVSEAIRSFQTERLNTKGSNNGYDEDTGNGYDEHSDEV